MVKNNILETIGNTPMVRINNFNLNPRVNIYAKLEGFNPTGSIRSYRFADDRTGGTRGTVSTGENDHRTDFGEHGDRVGHHRDREGVSRGNRDERGCVRGTSKDYPFVRW